MPIHTTTVEPETHMKSFARGIYSFSSNIASPPVYTCSVTSTRKNIIIVDKDNNLPQDLIFSIQVSNNNTNSYRLKALHFKALHFWIPLGKADANYLKLFENYTGPGPSMLSNLRFNVLPKFENNPGSSPKLRLSLIPRSKKGWVDITIVREMGFKLALAQVNRFTRNPVQMHLRYQPVYDSPSIPDKEYEFLVTIYNE